MRKLTDHQATLWRQFGDGRAWDRCPNADNRPLSESLWATLGQPWLPPETQQELGSEWANCISGEMEDLPELRQLHKRIDGDPWSVMVCHRVLMGAIGWVIPESGLVVKPESALLRELDGLNDLANRGVVIQTQLSSTEAATRMLGNAAAAYVKMVEADLPAIRNAVRDACDAARQEMDDLAQIEGLMGSGWGIGGGVLPTATDIARRERLASKVWNGSGKIRRILSLAGRMLRVADQVQASKVDSDTGEIVGVQFGDDIESSLPEEMARLAAGGGIETSFWVDFMERSVMRYRCIDREPLAKGPVVYLVDESGSMAGEREEWAKAIAMVLAKLCREQRRDLLVGTFSREIKWECEMPLGVVPEEAVTEWLGSETSSGGTDYQVPLDWAVNRILENDAMGRADVIFVTDDTCGVQEEWLAEWKARRRKAGIRVIGMGIECRSEILSDICDVTHEVTPSTMDAAGAFSI